jgi:hypothetical protein
MSNDNLPAIQNWSPQFTGKVTFDYDDVTYTVENGKIYNDLHEVAVVYSPGYGGGWTAYNKVAECDEIYNIGYDSDSFDITESKVTHTEAS